jgi:pilus assembly protein CpaB
MGAARLAIVLAIAAIAALALALLVRSMTLAHKPGPVVAAAPVVIQRPMTRVLVARHDLKVADRINSDNVGWQPWPSETVNRAYITGGVATVQPDLASKASNVLENVERGDAAMQALAGSLVREPILANEPITQTKLVRGDGSFMAVKLPEGMRAMSIPITAESDAGGFVLPGDRVDVVLSLKAQGGGDPAAGKGASSRLVMRNIKVLAIDQTTEPKSQQSSMIGATATLEIPADDIDALARAKTQGDLTLILRSYADAAGPSGRVGSTDSLDLGDVVRVYRSGQVSEVRVAR